MSSTPPKSRREILLNDIKRMHELEQQFLRGLANRELNFQTDKNGDFEKTMKASMVSTYAFLYIGSLMVDKIGELAQLDAEEKADPLSSQDEKNSDK